MQELGVGFEQQENQSVRSGKEADWRTSGAQGASTPSLGNRGPEKAGVSQGEQSQLRLENGPLPNVGLLLPRSRSACNNSR